MLNMQEAKKIVLDNRPTGTIIKEAILHGNEFLFLAIGPDVLEGNFDPFFKVNANTGAFTDFSPQDYPNPREILDQLNPAGI